MSNLERSKLIAADARNLHIIRLLRGLQTSPHTAARHDYVLRDVGPDPLFQLVAYRTDFQLRVQAAETPPRSAPVGCTVPATVPDPPPHVGAQQVVAILQLGLAVSRD